MDTLEVSGEEMATFMDGDDRGQNTEGFKDGLGALDVESGEGGEGKEEGVRQRRRQRHRQWRQR